MQVSKLERRLGRLTADEKIVLGMYVKNDVRSRGWSGDSVGTAQGLADDGILYRPDVASSHWTAPPYNITNEALTYLQMNRQLVDAGE